MGSLAGGLLIMNRLTKFLAQDEESSLVMLLGCVFIGTSLFMRFGDAILVPTRTIPQTPIQHSKMSILITTLIGATGVCTLFRGLFCFFASN